MRYSCPITVGKIHSGDECSRPSAWRGVAIHWKKEGEPPFDTQLSCSLNLCQRDIQKFPGWKGRNFVRSRRKCVHQGWAEMGQGTANQRSHRRVRVWHLAPMPARPKARDDGPGNRELPGHERQSGDAPAIPTQSGLWG